MLYIFLFEVFWIYNFLLLYEEDLLFFAVHIALLVALNVIYSSEYIEIDLSGLYFCFPLVLRVLSPTKFF